jgi:RIO kinase 1
LLKGKEFSRIDRELDKLKNRIKGLEDLKVSEDVFDRFTLLTLYDISNKGYIDVLYGSIKTGKESNVFLAKDPQGHNYAIKIHRILTSDFGAMLKYIEGDRRFKKVKRTRRSIILTWVEKEFKNLITAYDAGVNVPRPIFSRNNVVVMEFIGDNTSAAPTLKDTKLKTNSIYKKVMTNLKKLYDAGLVHGDLSEYNILVKNKEPVIIDLSQAVPVDHPLGEELLKRDLKNISRYFGKKFDKVYSSIVKQGEDVLNGIC